MAVSALQPLLFDKGDVLVAGSFSALTVAHVAVAAGARSGRVLVCGADHTPLQTEEMKELLSQMNIKSKKQFWLVYLYTANSQQMISQVTLQDKQI